VVGVTSTYILVLAAEAGVVAAAGFFIAYLAGTNTEVILYSRAIALLGFGLGVAGVGTIALAFDVHAVATALMAVAAASFIASGWRIATDAVDPDESLPTERLASTSSRGFEEDS
jgi:hypothetical protein